MQSPVLEFDKNCTLNAYFLQKFNFCIFEPKNREVIENSSKTPLNFSSLQYTYLGKHSFQYHQGLVRKKEIEKWLLRTSVQCIMIYQGHTECTNSNRMARIGSILYGFKCICEWSVIPRTLHLSVVIPIVISYARKFLLKLLFK